MKIKSIKHIVGISALLVLAAGAAHAAVYDPTWTKDQCEDYSFNGLNERYVLGGGCGWVDNNIWGTVCSSCTGEGVDCSSFANRCLAIDGFIGEGACAPHSWTATQWWLGSVPNTVSITQSALQRWDTISWSQSSGCVPGSDGNHIFLCRSTDASWIYTREARTSAIGIVDYSRSKQFCIDYCCRYHRRTDWGDDALAVKKNVHMFGVGSGGAVNIKSWSAGGWTGWTSLGESVTGGPDALSRTSDQVGVVIHSATSPGHIKYRPWTTAGAWGNWVDLWSSGAGNMTSDPGSVARGPDNIHVAARNGSGTCSYKSYTSGAWGNWFVHSGKSIVGGPDLYSLNSTHYAIVVRGTDNHLWVINWNNGSWGNWVDLGGNFASDPTAVARGTDHAYVFARGTDNTLYRINWNQGLGWQSKAQVDTNIIVGGPDALSRGPDQASVVARFASNNYYYKMNFATGSGWGGWTEVSGIPMYSDPGAVAR